MTHRIVSMNWVRNNLHNPSVILADCRFDLGRPSAEKQKDEKEFLPNSLHFDLERDLSSPIQQHGGRHPLPEISSFVQKLETAGIDNYTHVIAYDDQDGAMASRLWWLLTYLGHEKVSVMDGNFTDWKRLGYPLADQLVKRPSATFIPKIQHQMVVSMEEVKQNLTKPDTVIIDSREEKRYLGEIEPIDSVAGHIPGAYHSFWKQIRNEEGYFLSSDKLKQHFQNIPTNKEIIVYCGSGVTATPNILALKEAGWDNVKLYAGSWSDWISYPVNPVEKGKQKND